ncbi:unnamed protein product [Urochloa decumbens]|uniref:DUF6598 domain-containing protein n=1 Tax=Urochloa decumbens TaxID=240449 RepID=A0ABC9G5J5_9POAL
MGKVWDWNNIYGTKLKKFDGCDLHTASEDGKGSEDDAAALPEDSEGDLEDGYGDEEVAADPLEDHGYSGEEDAAAPLEDDDQNYRGAPSEDSDDDIPFGRRAVQLLAIRANFHVCVINGYDWQLGRCIYRQHEGEVQEEGMVDLVPTGPSDIFMAYGGFTLEFYHSIGKDCDVCGAPITLDWDVCEDEDPKEYTETICCGGPGRMLEITYLVIPNTIETNVEVKLKLKDLGSRNRTLYGKIKVSTADYGNKRVHLFTRGRGRSWSVPSGPTSILPLSSSVVALPYRRQLEFHIEVDLTAITIFDNKEKDKSLKFSLKFTRGIRSQEREVDGDQVEVSITFNPEI